ncbi:MAG TPA: hypothetical protein VF395_10975 [Polyangiaceae bacterium]
MRAREGVVEAVRQGRLDDVAALVRSDPRAVRQLVALTYRPEPDVRANAARGLALAAHHHPRLVQEVARRLVWAMNEESGTHAVNAPEVLRAVAEETPELLRPLVPNLLRLTGDARLRDALVEVVRLVARNDPRSVVDGMAHAIANCGKGKTS